MAPSAGRFGVSCGLSAPSAADAETRRDPARLGAATRRTACLQRPASVWSARVEGHRPHERDRRRESSPTPTCGGRRRSGRALAPRPAWRIRSRASDARCDFRMSRGAFGSFWPPRKSSHRLAEWRRPESSRWRATPRSRANSKAIPGPDRGSCTHDPRLHRPDIQRRAPSIRQ
jgi:hypothetical protein